MKRHRSYIAGKIAFNQCDSGDPVGNCFAGGAAVAQMENGSAFVMGREQAILSEKLGIGSHQFALPLFCSLIAGLSTGIGGMLALFLRRGSTANDGITALTLAAAATAMITVSAVDLFYHISRDIGLHHTLASCACGFAVVLAAKTCGPGLVPASKEGDASEGRLLRVGLITALTLTAHNFPEGMAVAISTMGSVNLGLKLTFAIALHNIPEGLAIACPLIMSRRHSRLGAVAIAFASGLSEPVGALATLVLLQSVVTQERIDYALACVGGVMMAVAVLELLPEARRLARPGMTLAGAALGACVMSASLLILG